jgi:hypothetical protein
MVPFERNVDEKAIRLQEVYRSSGVKEDVATRDCSNNSMVLLSFIFVTDLRGRNDCWLMVYN